ncbi:MAG: hypothetical protein NT105_22175 [Verrucomicrobia bacterium]|nr:hypothetical protein [Verrucomicrobiota bacterium]
MNKNFSTDCGVLSRALGAARTDYTIIIAFMGVVFFTGQSWVMPLAHRWLPALDVWLAGASASARLAGCGVIAVLLVSLLVGAAMYLTRPK